MIEKKRGKGFIVLMLIIGIVFVISFSGGVLGAEYYVDYETGDDTNDGSSTATPWKRCPGMVGFSGSYIHIPGDKFIFKGGVTWPSSTLPLTVSSSGNLGNVDEYITNENWYFGLNWSRPVFDMEGTGVGANPMFFINNRNYIRISGIKFVNGGISGGTDGGYTIRIVDSGNIEIDNCRLQPYSHHGIVGYYGYLQKNHTNILIHDNEFSDASNFIEFGITDGNIDVFEIYNNTFRDPWSMAVNYDHIDGIHFFRASGTGVITNLKIYNNFFTGNWGGRDENTGGTAMIYLEHKAQISPMIYNNLLSYKIEDSPNIVFFRALIFLSGGQDAKIFNNILLGRNVYDDMSVGIDIYYWSKNVEVKNNIITGMKNCIRIGPDSTVSSIDNNILWPVPGTSVGVVGTDFCSWSKWQDTYGYDLNGFNEDPLYISTIYPYDLKLQSTSPAIDSGTDLSVYFTTDFDGVSRPQGLAWDIGAYEFLQTGTTCSPADADTDGVVDIIEIMAYITEWKAGNVDIVDLMAGITEWKNGC